MTLTMALTIALTMALTTLCPSSGSESKARNPAASTA
eukprot:CAMPEP_0181330110 /NCGR_PEP_ID=MMETSP1101-20121128/23706_1 /TAXON_ID=46948 /ORGANISM="Rhodomonas abbreviata, Strain Caron Lab Isolate" /LENGTH=36 /DNA_ID= /DNA_START= /DNA_END= /DNA_ORIENTATION=